jgi:hypothetical protein
MSSPPPYGFGVDLERAIALRLCTMPKLHALIGSALVPARFVDEQARLVVDAARLVALDTGRGPAAFTVALERLRQEMLAGRVTFDQLQLAEDLFLDAPPESRLPTMTEIVALVKPLVSREMQANAVRAGMDEFAKGGDFANVETQLRNARKFGVVEQHRGLRMGADSLSAIRLRRQSDRLPTPIMELSAQLGGGLMRGKAAMIGAGSKVGKSTWLTAQNGSALIRGMFVLHASLELSEEDTQARQMAYLTGVPIDAILDGSMEAECMRRLAVLAPQLGVFKVRFFPAKATTFPDIAQWIAEEEDEEKRKVDLVTLDYIDKMGAADRTLRGEYEVQGAASEEFRLYCHNRQVYGWTASQGKRKERADRGKRMDLDDFADSQNKVRVFDLILTAHKPNAQEVEVYVAGNRNGASEFSVGPFAHDFACARIVQPFDIPVV